MDVRLVARMADRGRSDDLDFHHRNRAVLCRYLRALVLAENVRGVAREAPESEGRVRKRSRTVFLLAPLTLTACDDAKQPPYASMTECRSYSRDACSPAPNPAGHGGIVFVPNNYAALAAHQSAVGNRMIAARAYRGGFGVSARAMGATAAA